MDLSKLTKAQLIERLEASTPGTNISYSNFYGATVGKKSRRTVEALAHAAEAQARALEANGKAIEAITQTMVMKGPMLQIGA